MEQIQLFEMGTDAEKAKAQKSERAKRLEAERAAFRNADALWKNQVESHAQEILNTIPPRFLMEDFRRVYESMAQEKGLALPHAKQAWAGIARLLVSQGFAVRCGYEARANGVAATVYEKTEKQ